ncbi:hypothetical protein AAHA92_01182 [Salvia divinorum]|uniref:Uncharacterized protein n=1 Tax=Salvia divinorum TaxID=28513 RepID=A0ABD1IML3_SALDI
MINQRSSPTITKKTTTQNSRASQTCRLPHILNSIPSKKPERVQNLFLAPNPILTNIRTRDVPISNDDNNSALSSTNGGAGDASRLDCPAWTGGNRGGGRRGGGGVAMAAAERRAMRLVRCRGGNFKQARDSGGSGWAAASAMRSRTASKSREKGVCREISGVLSVPLIQVGNKLGF